MGRTVVAIVLAVACIALSFTQLGFVGIGSQGVYSAYAFALLLPVALAALLLGSLAGMLMGLFAGTMLYVHSLVMPLDFYEVTYITPFSSIVLLGLTGLILGLLFRFALRNDPSPVKCIIYIVLICTFVSWVYSMGFLFNAFVKTVFDIAIDSMANPSEDSIGASAEARAAAIIIRLGAIDTQAWADASLMAIACILGELGARRAMRPSQRPGLRGTFAVWFSVVVLIAFMITSGASFVFITEGEIADSAEDMRGEADYLCDQIENAEQRTSTLIGFLEHAGLDTNTISEDQIADASKSASLNTLLDGYTPDTDGTIIVLDPSSTGTSTDAQVSEREAIGNSTIAISDNERLAVETKLNDAVNTEIVQAIAESIAMDDVRRSVYDEITGATLDELAEDDEQYIQSEIIYLFAEKADDGKIVVIMYPANKVFANRPAVMGSTAISTFFLLAAVFAMTYLLLSRLVVRRIDETNGVLARITDGDLDARVEVRETREFDSLSNGVNETVGALKDSIAEAESRIDAELATAKAIQESALPRIFPPFPDILKFDIYATMNAAKEVGGDFYDFFLIGDSDSETGKLGFVMADVSGKGVPAALFMMKAKTQLRDYLASGMEVGEAVENANRQLCEGNDTGMFVTAWVGVLDYSTGNVEFVNAGHNPPLLWQKNGGWRWMSEKSGLPLGLFDGFPYEAYRVECGIGDELLLYTDGVTEAMNVEGDLYGEERLEAFAEQNYTLHPRMLVEALRRDVATFAEGAEQSDDITILSLEVGVPPEVTATLIVPADVGELPRVNEFIHTELDRRLCPLRVQNQIDIAVEELFVNVAHYAYPSSGPDDSGTVRVSYTYSAEPPSITIQIADNGIPYDPLAKPDAVTPDDVMDVPIGGLGILMAKRSVDEMSYERVDESNVVSIVKKW